MFFFVYNNAAYYEAIKRRKFGSVRKTDETDRRTDTRLLLRALRYCLSSVTRRQCPTQVDKEKVKPVYQ